MRRSSLGISRSYLTDHLLDSTLSNRDRTQGSPGFATRRDCTYFAIHVRLLPYLCNTIVIYHICQRLGIIPLPPFWSLKGIRLLKHPRFTLSLEPRFPADILLCTAMWFGPQSADGADSEEPKFDTNKSAVVLASF